MKRSIITSFGLAFASSLLLGCAGVDAEGEGADFPEPIGYDQAMQAHPGQTQTASMSTPVEQPAPGPSLAPGEVPGSTSEERIGVQPESTDIQLGANGEYADTDPAALTDFRPALDPYGSWVEDPTYGTVWTPSANVVGSDFAPYVSAGHWAYDDQWTWVSDYEWGWAPFHYGRWVYIGNRGWGWIPGRVYSGAWVSWRYGYDDYGYIGWAPMPPTWYWYGGVAVGIAVVPRAPYVFCGYHDVFRGDVGHAIVTGPQVGVVAGHTRPYTPAQPTVGGSGRTPAHPTVGGGPPPSSIGLTKDQITHIPPNNRGIMHAQQFAMPSSAERMGARPPAQTQQHVAMTAPGARMASAPSRSLGIMPSYRDSAVATAPRYQGIAPTPYHAPSYSNYGSYGSMGRAPTTRSFSVPNNVYRPSYGGYSGYGAMPHYGSMGSPSYAPRFGGGYGGYHPGSGGVPGQSSSSSSSSSSTPSYGPVHPSSGGFHGGTHMSGGGGFHGGGVHMGGGHR